MIRFFVCVFAIFTFGFVAARGGGDFDPAAFEPDLPAAPDVSFSGRTWTVHGGAWTVELQRISDAERLELFRGVTGLGTDPFAPADPARPSFISFLLQIGNRSPDSLEFNGQNSWLVTNKKEILYPLGLDRLQSAFATVGRSPSAAFEKIRPLLIEGRLVVDPGSSASGVLVYRAPEKTTKRFRVELQLMDAAGAVKRIELPYRKMSRRTKKQRNTR